MADELDKFESQLIAYLDGALSPADALALEQKLAAYPQHRGLMEDLRRQRELLQALPTEPAPGALKSQLRTQVQQAGVTGLLHRRLYRIAASILLTLGAGIIVYQLLPPRGAEPLRLATNMRSPTPVTFGLHDGESPPAAEAMAASKGDAMKRGVVPGVELAQMQQPRQQMFANSSAGRTVINVATDNPTVLQAEIGRLLRSNRIAYSEEAEIPADTQMADASLRPSDGLAVTPGYAGKAAGPSPIRRDSEEKASADLDSANDKVAPAAIAAKAAAEATDTGRNRRMAKSEGESGVLADAKQSGGGRGGATGLDGSRVLAEGRASDGGLQPPAMPAMAPAPNAAPPVAQAARQQLSLNQQVLVARNVSSLEVAQIEQALRDRQLAQKLNYRVRETSNSQIASPAPVAGTISRLNVVTTTRPAVLPSVTAPIQAKGAAQTMDLLIVVEPESK